MSNEHVPYDAVIHWLCDTDCNLTCKYCFGLSNEWLQKKSMWGEGPSAESHWQSGEYKKSGGARPIDSGRLLSVLERTGKIFKIVFTANHGEPFIIPNFIEACQKITEKHYIALTTNLTLPVVRQFAEKIQPQRVCWIVASAQMEEMERRGLTDQYIKNFLFLEAQGFPVYSQAVAYPPLQSKADRVRKFFKKNGIELKFMPFYGTCEGLEYPKAYNDQQLAVFGLRIEDKEEPDFFGKLCNAGYNSVLALPDGNVIRCTVVDQHLGNVYEDIRFTQQLMECPVKFCPCPVLEYEHELFMKALQKENKDRSSK